jgi:pentatricopeptide repeat protein
MTLSPSQLIETGLKPDLELYNTMIKLYCESGNMEKAMELFTSNETHSFSSDV